MSELPNLFGKGNGVSVLEKNSTIEIIPKYDKIEQIDSSPEEMLNSVNSPFIRLFDNLFICAPVRFAYIASNNNLFHLFFNILMSWWRFIKTETF